MEITLCVLQDIIPFGAAALRRITEKYKCTAGQGLTKGGSRRLEKSHEVWMMMMMMMMMAASLMWARAADKREQ